MDKKTECEIVQDLLLGYADDVLNKESKKLVEKHLIECTECQEKLNDIKIDIENNENNQKKQIDYLKKVRRKNNIKAIFIAILVIIFILFIIWLRKFIIISDLMNKAEKTLKSENLYFESTQVLLDGEVSVTKEWYKDGKYKKVTEIYSDDGVEISPTEYATINTDKRIVIDHEKKKVSIGTGEMTRMQNDEKSIKNTQFGQQNNLFLNMGKAIYYSIHTSTRDIGREYYVLKNIIDKDSKHEEWIDKDTGLPLKISGNGSMTSYFEGTNVVKEEIDMCFTYKYEFDSVKDEDVKIPDYTGYEIENVGLKEENEQVEISSEVKEEIEEYINKICNPTCAVRVDEFNDINEASKKWIYSHLESTATYVTEDEIKSQLQELFGNNLIIDVKNDIASTDDVVMPTYDESIKKYALPIFGMDNTPVYAINSIELNNGKYIVNVIEYNEMADLYESDNFHELIISKYDETIEKSWKWKEVFRVNQDTSEDEIVKEVLKRKDEFQSYNITLEKNDNNFIVKKLTK